MKNIDDTKSLKRETSLFPVASIKEWTYKAKGPHYEERKLSVKSISGSSVYLEYSRGFGDSNQDDQDYRIYYSTSGNKISVDSQFTKIDSEWVHEGNIPNNIVVSERDTTFQGCHLSNLFGEVVLGPGFGDCDSITVNKVDGDTVTVIGGANNYYKFTTHRIAKSVFVKGIGLVNYTLIETTNGCFQTVCASGIPDTLNIGLEKYMDYSGAVYIYK